jgi:hypothetical protein
MAQDIMRTSRIVAKSLMYDRGGQDKIRQDKEEDIKDIKGIKDFKA